MQTITENQYNNLSTKIYDTLMAMDGMGLGEMGQARDTANEIVDEWMEQNKITLQ